MSKGINWLKSYVRLTNLYACTSLGHHTPPASRDLSFNNIIRLHHKYLLLEDRGER